MFARRISELENKVVRVRLLLLVLVVGIIIIVIINNSGKKVTNTCWQVLTDD